MRLSDIEKYSYKAYPAFIDDSVGNPYNFSTIGKVKNSLVSITKKRLDQAISQIMHNEEIQIDELSRLKLYPIGVAEYWKSADEMGFNHNSHCLGLFLNDQGIQALSLALRNKQYPSERLDMHDDFYIKQILNSFGDVT